MALVLDEIWYLRNQVLHKRCRADVKINIKWFSSPSWSLCPPLGCTVSNSGKLDTSNFRRGLQNLLWFSVQPDVVPNWTISSILCFKASFLRCSFHWVRRVCNSAAHVVARLALSSRESFVSIVTTCQRSCSLHVRLIVQLVLFFELHCSLSIYIYIYIYKKRETFFFSVELCKRYNCVWKPHNCVENNCKWCQHGSHGNIAAKSFNAWFVLDRQGTVGAQKRDQRTD